MQLLEALAEQIGKETVVAVPATLVVERDQEQAGLLQLRQDLPAVLRRIYVVETYGHRITQRDGQPIEDRGLE